MFAFVTKWPVLFFVFVIKLNELKHVLADDGPKPLTPTASTNVSTVAMGSAFTLKCEMPTVYAIRNNEFSIDFIYNISGVIAKYIILASDTTGARQQFFYTFLDGRDKPYIASIEQMNRTASPTSNTFEVIITTTKKAYSAQFSCRAWYNHLYSDDSKQVLVTVTDKFLPTLTSSDSHVHLHQPLTLTCSLPENFRNLKAYQVAFLNSRDGLMADYEVEASGKTILVSKDLTNVTVALGARKAFPTFDLALNEQASQKLSYWCELYTLDSTTQKTNFSAESAHWKPAGPFVDFSASNASVSGGSEHRGRCSLDELVGFSEKEYQVLFYSSSLGSASGVDNLLGYFWLRPHEPVQFVTETVNHWTSIVHGASVEYPNFEITGKLDLAFNVKNHQWWCALNYTEPGQSQPRKIKSNFQAL